MSDLSTVVSHAVAASLNQHWPQPCLLMVASPIGNLADVTVRALHALALADTIACEDTRHTQALLRAYGLNKPASAWLAVHEHNEQQAAHEVIVRLQAGQRVVYLCDAGTPGLSDPGTRLVAAVHAVGLRVSPLPGASSATALLSVCGDAARNEWVFMGFLPARGAARDSALRQLQQEGRGQLLLESPHRIEALAQSLGVLGERRITVGRELTKQFEEVQTLAAKAFSEWLAAHGHRTKGEFVIMVHALAQTPHPVTQGTEVMRTLMTELPLGQAARLAAQISGASRKDLYQWGLAQKTGSNKGEDLAASEE